MALSKSQIKRIEKYSKPYYVIIPMGNVNIDKIKNCFNSRSEYVKTTQKWTYYVFDKKEYEKVKKFLGTESYRFITVDKYSYKEEVFRDLYNGDLLFTHSGIKGLKQI